MKNIEKLVNKAQRFIVGRQNGLGENIPKIFFCHVPKCAGLSVSKQIWKQIFSGHEVGNFWIDLYASRKASQIFSVDRMDASEFVLTYNLSLPQNYYGTGHVSCRPHVVEAFASEWDFVTLLRNPVDRWISEYVYNTYKDNDWEKNTLPIEDYLSTRKAWKTGVSYIRYFSSMPSDHVGNCDEFVDEVVENLGRFSVIGVVEKLNNWCVSFEKRFGKTISIPQSNTSPNSEIAERIRSNGLLMKKIEMLCEPDIRVYQRISDRLL